MLETLYHFNALFDKAFIPKILSMLVRPSSILPLSLSQKDIYGIIKNECHDSLSDDECINVASGPFDVSSLKDLVASVSSLFLEPGGDLLCVRFNRVLDWREFTEKNGEDLFACQYYADSCKSKMLFNPRLNWPFCLATNNVLLNDCLAKGMSENHFHLNGSSPTFYLNWVSLHNAPSFLRLFDSSTQDAFSEHYDLEILSQYKSFCYLAVVTRKYLFHLIEGGLGAETKNEYIKFIELYVKGLDKTISLSLPKDPLLAVDSPSFEGLFGYRYDYAERLVKTNSPSIETGERGLLFHFFYDYENYTEFDKGVFYLYLCVKKYISSFFFQNNDSYGFKNFTHFEKFGDLFLNHGSLKKSDLSFFAGRYLVQNKKLNNVELRIAPGGTLTSLREKIQMNIEGIQSSADNAPAKFLRTRKPPFNFFFTLHFIKSPDTRFSKNSLGFCLPRNMKPRNEALVAGNSIIALVSSIKKKDYLIVGIDAANCEIGCRPETYGLIYRKLRQYSYVDDFQNRYSGLGLHFTYHVAEDFLGLVDGIRAIFEAVTFLNMQNGDRLGHCVALGTNPEHYFSLKNYELYQKRQDLLDDNVFLYFQLKNAGKLDSAFAANLEEYCENELRDLYGDYSLLSYYHSMLLRGDDPELFKDYIHCDKPLVYDRYRANTGDVFYKESIQDFHARKLCFLYHYSAAVREKSNSLVCYRVSEKYISAVKILQILIKELILKTGLSIETNPTSNYLIGPFQRYCEVPTFDFNCGKWREPNAPGNIPITINTDDEGIFRTSLSSEYAFILYQLIVEDPYVSGFKNVSPEKAYDYIEELRVKSNDLSFK